MNTPVVADASYFRLPEEQHRPLRWALYIGYIALTAGIFHGLAQALSYAKIDILEYFPALRSYYQGLTAHGVANVLIFTFSFSNGFLPLMTARALSQRLVGSLLWASFGFLLAGNLLVIYAVVSNQASVLYTSYAPLQAHWTYYLGLVFVVVSTWLALLNMLIVYRRWYRGRTVGRTPLLAHISLVSYLMWFIASLPIAVSFIFLLLPWSMGLQDKTDPLLVRTLFWFSGHAIVYAWLLPAYVSWYALIPRQVGGTLISDSLVRYAFILFFLLSIPTGFHHQFTDPGISTSMKGFHTVLTFGVFYPSLATAFTVMAALEIGGRRRGGKGLLGWIGTLPWNDPSVAAQLLAMIAFVFGGITGLINASYSMNLVIHNTTWVPGHFHLTIGTAVTLTLMGVAYWLIPYLTGRRLVGQGLGLFSSWIYFIGVLIFARGMISAGLGGMPRRIFRAQAPYGNPEWELGEALTGIGGTMMFIGILCFFIVCLFTIFGGERQERVEDIPFTETLGELANEGAVVKFDSLKLWFGLTVLLVLIAYGPFFITYLPPNFVSIGYRLW